MRQVVSFDKLKLTNNELDDQGHVSQKDMHSIFSNVHLAVPFLALSIVQTMSVTTLVPLS